VELVAGKPDETARIVDGFDPRWNDNFAKRALALVPHVAVEFAACSPQNNSPALGYGIGDRSTLKAVGEVIVLREASAKRGD